MEIYQLRTLIIVAREQHLTRAAELLHISQPAVSGQIKTLEQELGLTLFERKHGGIQLTKAGASLLTQVDKVLEAADDLTNAARKLSGKIIGRISLGIILDPEFIRLGELTTRLLKLHPLLDVDIRHRNSITVLSSIRSHELDASFYLGREVPSDMASIDITPVAYRIVASSGWKARLAQAGWNELAEMPWVTTPREGAFFQMINTLFRSHGLQLKNVIEADQESAIVNLVRSGVGLSLIREELAAAEAAAGKLIMWNEERTFSKLLMIFLAGRRDDPIIQTIGSAVKTVWADVIGETAA
jgi:DNA-binding transcriptional LysR family regulator